MILIMQGFLELTLTFQLPAVPASHFPESLAPIEEEDFRFCFFCGNELWCLAQARDLTLVKYLEGEIEDLLQAPQL